MDDFDDEVEAAELEEAESHSEEETSVEVETELPPSLRTGMLT